MKDLVEPFIKSGLLNTLNDEKQKKFFKALSDLKQKMKTKKITKEITKEKQEELAKLAQANGFEQEGTGFWRRGRDKLLLNAILNPTDTEVNIRNNTEGIGSPLTATTYEEAKEFIIRGKGRKKKMIKCKDFFKYGKKRKYKIRQEFVYEKVLDYLIQKVGLEPNNESVESIAGHLSDSIYYTVNGWLEKEEDKGEKICPK